jgi:hypothetical protein
MTPADFQRCSAAAAAAAAIRCPVSFLMIIIAVDRPRHLSTPVRVIGALSF